MHRKPAQVKKDTDPSDENFGKTRYEMNRLRVFSNVKWMVVCKTIQSFLQLIIGMLTARYLGPSDYGLINYAKSIVAIIIPFVLMGLDSILVKELIDNDNPEQEDRIMGTSLALGVMSGLCWVVLIGCFVLILNTNETETILVCTLYSVSIIFQSTTLMQYWYQSKFESRYPATIQLIAYVIVSAYKICLLIMDASVYWFAIAYSIEYGVVGISLWIIYRKVKGRRLHFSFSLAKQLVLRSYPYIWASLMVIIFQNTDHVMLKMMVGNEENGFYTAAVTTVGICQYVYYAIIDSMRPAIIEKKKDNPAKYENSISKLYGVIFYLALIQGVVFTIFADPLIRLMYGSAYTPAVSIVRILVWHVSFSFMGAIRNVWILAEGKQRHLWKINLFGSIGNICLNLMLIPKFSAVGAATASLLTQLLTNVLFGFIYKPIRKNNRLLINGLRMGIDIRWIKSGLNE